MIEEWNESRTKTKEEIQNEREKEAWKNLMYAIGTMGSIVEEPISVFYKKYHTYWDILIDRARIYKRVAKLNEKYGLDDKTV